MKKFTTSLMLLLLLIVASACGSEEANQSGGGNSEDGTFTLKFAGMSPEDHPSTMAMNDLAEKVKEATEGRINIEVYPANQLGDWSSVYQEIGMGTIEMGLITNPTEQDPRAEVLAFPFVAQDFSNLEEIYGADSYIYNMMQEVNNDAGIRVLGFFGEEFGGLGTAKKIDNIEDIGTDKDILLRVPALDVQVQMMKGLGFRTTTIPFADLYTSLQTGVADGWIGGGASYNYTSFRDVIKYYYKINDQFIATPFLINEELWQQFSKEDQEAIDKIAQETMKESFVAAEEREKEYLKLMEDEGIEIIELDPSAIDAYAEFARREMWPQFKERVGAEVIDGLVEYLDSIK